MLVGDLEQVPTYLGDFEGAHDDTRYGRVAGGRLLPRPACLAHLRPGRDAGADTGRTSSSPTNATPSRGGRWYARAAGVASDQGVPTDAVRAGWLRDDLLAYGLHRGGRDLLPDGNDRGTSAKR